MYEYLHIVQQMAYIRKCSLLEPCSSSLYPPFLCADVQNVISSNESVAVLVFQLTIYILFGLLKSNVHVAVKTRENTSVVQT